MSLYTVTVLSIEFMVFSKWKHCLNARSCWMLADPILFLHDSKRLCCNMSEKNYVFVLILVTSDKKHVFLFSDFFFKTAKNRKKPTKQSNPFFCLQTFSDEGREGHSNLFMCCFSGYGCCCQVFPICEC